MMAPAAVPAEAASQSAIRNHAPLVPLDEPPASEIPSSTNRLYQRKRGQCQRHDVEPEPGCLPEETGQPTSAAEQQAQRMERPANLQRGQLRGCAVLAQVAPVERTRRCKRQRECDDDLGAHDRSVAAARRSRHRASSPSVDLRARMRRAEWSLDRIHGRR